MTTGLLPELTLGGEAPPPRTLVEIFRATVAAHALRLTVGDDTFFEILRTWVAEHAGGTVDTEMFLEHCERVAGQDVRPVLGPWLDELPLPDLPAA